jgi:hypothetical protein
MILEIAPLLNRRNPKEKQRLLPVNRRTQGIYAKILGESLFEDWFVNRRIEVNRRNEPKTAKTSD